MPGDVIDLTLSSDSDKEPALKRRRWQSAGPSRQGRTIDNGDNDGDVIVVDPVRKRPRPRPSTGDPDLGDDDLVITAATGQVATRDLPHSRSDCADHQFSTTTSASNATHCPQCFCFVCDVKASACRYWGTGARERDHANARPLGYWRRLREAARAGNTSHVHAEYHGSGPFGSGAPQQQPLQQTRLPFPVAALKTRPSGPVPSVGGAGEGQPATAANGHAGASTHPHASDAMRAAPATAATAAAPSPGPTPLAAAAATAAKDPAAGPAKKASSGAPLPSGVCRLRPLPDPGSDRFAFELGVFRFGVKAASGHSIAELAGRLQRFGFYYDVNKTRWDDYGDKLSLSNMLDTRYGMYGGKYKIKSIYLKILPLPPPPEEAVPEPTERVRKVLVVDCLGRTRPTMMGVRVHDKCRRADLLLSLAPELRPRFSSSSELLHLVHFYNIKSRHVNLVDPDSVLDDAFFSNCCKNDDGPQLVVFRTSHHPAPSWPVRPGLLSADAASTPPSLTEMPVYVHKSEAASGLPQPSGPAWVVAHVRQFTPPRSRAAAAEELLSPSTTLLTMPLLVPLRMEHARGGREAEREFTSALLRGLQPFRTASPLVKGTPVIVLRGNACLMTDWPSRSSSDSWAVTGDPIGNCSQGSLVQQLTAVMPHDLSATSYRLGEMRTPVVDPSASPEALRASDGNIAETKRREESLRKRKAAPREVISELVRASQRAHPEDKATMAICYSCKVATDVSLQPSSGPGATARDGELIIKVYTWTATSAGRMPLFDVWDNWPPRDKRNGGFPLTKTMELLVTCATDPCEAAGEAGTAAGSAGPSTSRGAGAAALSSVELQRQVQVERRRARHMVDSTRELSSHTAYERTHSVNGLLDFMQSGERPPVEQPPGLAVSMRPYQLQSLAFMLELERLVDTPTTGIAGPSTSAGSAAAAALAAPADAHDGCCPGGYRQLFWLPVTNTRGQRYWYSPVFQRLAREVPAQPTGGFLAEEMGLGKTVEVMALTLANPAPASVVAGARLPCGRIASRATLVVCAVSLVGQWQAEAQSKTRNFCRIHPYHGSNRIRDPMRLATEFDVVLTTYQTLLSDSSKGTREPCQQIKWHRIVFDEGHILRSSSAMMYKTAVQLAADRRWLCTGTPINNAVDDLLGQFGAIHLMPLGKKTYFKSYIQALFHARGYIHDVNYMPLLYAIRHTMIRHTKAQSLGGEDVLQLPDKTETDVPVHLTSEEQELYRKTHKQAKRGWARLKALGVAYVNSHLFTATSMLMSLRRICSGGLLCPEDLVVPDPDRFTAAGGANGKGGAGEGAADGAAAGVPVPEDMVECPICVDTLDQPVVTTCNHWFCRECIVSWIIASVHHNCPSCRKPLTVASLRCGISQQACDPADGNAELTDAVPCESKLRVLLDELRAMRAADPTAKALVFTQFGRTLEWLKEHLIVEGFGYRSITGDMTLKKRTEAIESFQRDPNTCVFLLSVRSGAVGINLTAANHVFMLEPCMNPALEEQAIGRAWRMGQQRPVVVKRFYVKGSVEERIMEVVRMRRSATGGGGNGSGACSGSASGVSHQHGPAAGRGAGVGALLRDKTDLRISELERMFADPDFSAPRAVGGQ